MEPWYREGLRFDCTGCGRCCTGPPGYVWMRRAEIEAMAAQLRLTADAFGRRYLRRVGSRYALLERQNGDCIFFQPGRGCTVYRTRPAQCRTFPFWPENLKGRGAWESVAGTCEGIGRGRLYPPEEIDRIRRGQGDAPGH